jgi:hypothetical protein
MLNTLVILSIARFHTREMYNNQNGENNLNRYQVIICGSIVSLLALLSFATSCQAVK